jgi:hypothetical protein
VISAKWGRGKLKEERKEINCQWDEREGGGKMQF